MKFKRSFKVVISIIVFAVFFLNTLFTLECAIANTKGSHFKFEDAIMTEEPEALKIFKTSPYKWVKQK